MRKKLLFPLAGGAIALLMSSCFVLQSFTIVDYTLNIGQTTKARFSIRPFDKVSEVRAFQFVLVGLSSSSASDIGRGKAVWGTNGRFNGPLTMPANGAIATSIGTDCDSNGLNYSEIAGMSWKAYMTPQKINDNGLVEQKAVVDVNITPKDTATPGGTYTVMGIAGAWVDNNDNDTVDPADAFVCWGIGTSALFVKD
jgi:hypothetical protein